MPKYIKNAKIAMLDFSLQKVKMKLGVQLCITDPDKLENLRKRFFFKKNLNFNLIVNFFPQNLLEKVILLKNVYIRLLILALMLSLSLVALMSCVRSISWRMVLWQYDVVEKVI